MDIYQKVTDRVIKALEGGHIPWRRPWKTSWPMNLATGREYQGINLMLLTCTEFEQPYWCTLKQANRLGGSIRKGEKAQSFVVFAKESTYVAKDEQGNEILKKGFILRYSVVFNIEQTRGIEAPEQVEVEVEVQDAEDYLQRAPCQPVIKYGGDMACYYPGPDFIQMPPRSQFISSQGYYETLFHEIGHWSGGKARLNRNLASEQAARAREELVAEMFAGFALHRVGLDREIQNLTAYVQSWIKVLQDDKKAVLVAAREARRALQFFESGGAMA